MLEKSLSQLNLEKNETNQVLECVNWLIDKMQPLK